MECSTVGFIATLALGLIAAPLPPDEQQPAKPPRIGSLSARSPSDPTFPRLRQAFRHGLREHASIEGQTVAMAWRFAERRRERPPDLAGELVGLNVDPVVAKGRPPTQAANQATATALGLPIPESVRFRPLGTIIGDPASSDGSTGWRANYDTSPSGWSVEDCLTKVGVIAPPPSATTTPPARVQAVNDPPPDAKKDFTIAPGQHTPSYAINVKEFGAKGDGVTDDRAAIQAALNAAARPGQGGNTVVFPRGLYVSSGSLSIPAAGHGLAVVGAGALTNAGYDRGTWIRFLAGGFIIQKVSGIRIADIKVHLRDGAGPAFDLNETSRVTLERIHIGSGEPNQVLVRGRGTFIGNRIADFDFWPARGYRVPAIDLISSGGAMNNNIIERGTLQGNVSGTAPLIRMEMRTGVSTNNRLRDLIFETPRAGMIHLYSVQRSLIENIWGGDLNVDPTAPGISIKKSAHPGSQPSQAITIIAAETDFGTGANPTLFLDGRQSAQGGVFVHGSRFGVIGNNGPHQNPVVLFGTIYSSFVGDRPVEMGLDGRVFFPDMRNVRGVSSTETRPQNLRGSLTIRDANSSGAVIFSASEPDANYYAMAVVTATTGTPPNGAKHVSISGKNATGFTVNLEAAPGTKNSVTVDWILIR